VEEETGPRKELVKTQNSWALARKKLSPRKLLPLHQEAKENEYLYPLPHILPARICKIPL
jgi:hypothetical protein